MSYESGAASGGALPFGTNLKPTGVSASVARFVAHGQATKLAAFGKTQSSNTPTALKAEYDLDRTNYASYTNMAFVQAFGVASVADSANSQFAQDCLTYFYINQITGASDFSLGTAMVSSMVMAGILQPLTETAPGKTLATTFSRAGAMSAILNVPKTLAVTMTGEGVFYNSIKYGSAPASQSMAVTVRREGAFLGALTHSTQSLKTFIGGRRFFPG